jgi:hypothetical protein
VKIATHLDVMPVLKCVASGVTTHSDNFSCYDATLKKINVQTNTFKNKEEEGNEMRKTE